MPTGPLYTRMIIMTSILAPNGALKDKVDHREVQTLLKEILYGHCTIPAPKSGYW